MIFLVNCWKLLHNMIIMESLQNVIILFKLQHISPVWVTLVDTGFLFGLPETLGLVSIGLVLPLYSPCLLPLLGLILKKYS